MIPGRFYARLFLGALVAVAIIIALTKGRLAPSDAIKTFDACVKAATRF